MAPVAPEVTAAANWLPPPVREYSTAMPVAISLGSGHGLAPKVSSTSKKFLLDGSGATAPENEHPELEPLTPPFEVIVTVADAPSSKVPAHVPEIAEIDAAVS